MRVGRFGLKTRVTLDPAWISGMKNAPTTVPRELKQTLREVAKLVQSKARPRVPSGPGGRHNEKLGRSIRYWVKGYRAVVGSTLWYSRVQEEGTAYLPGGALRPRRKKWLHFKTADGRWVKRYQVRLPGHYYLKGGLEDSKPEIPGILRASGQRIARKVFEGR